MVWGKLGSRVLRYATGIGFTALVIGGRLALNPVLGETSNRHLVFLPAVMLVAWFAGYGPGIASALLCTAALVAFYTRPLGPSVDSILFLIIAAAIAGLIGLLQRTRARADQAAGAREQLLSIVAHDLRTPLSTITIAASALARDATVGETVQRRGATIHRCAQRMDNLIHDLVDATRIEHGGLQLAIQPTDVAGLLRETLEAFAPQARDKGITLEAPPTPAAVVIPADRDRLLRALGNLVSNALRFTPRGGQITLRAETHPSEVRLDVIDTGDGIAPEHLAHVFDRYWSSDRKGVGLGLHIVDSIVSAHGGRIRVESERGRGTRFWFTLPRGARPDPAPGNASVTASSRAAPTR